MFRHIAQSDLTENFDQRSHTYTLFGKDLKKKGGALESKRETSELKSFLGRRSGKSRLRNFAIWADPKISPPRPKVNNSVI